MALDSAPLARQAAEFMDRLTEKYGEDYDLDGCVMIASLRPAEGHEDEVNPRTEWTLGDLPVPYGCGLAQIVAVSLTEGEVG